MNISNSANAATLEDLGDLSGGTVGAIAYGISADGSVITGYSNNATFVETFRWKSDTGMIGLGNIIGGALFSIAYGISADGNTIIGYGFTPSGQQAFRWTSGTGMVGLGDLAGGGFSSTANATNGDGSIVVGYSVSGSGFEAFRWTSGTGMVGLGDLAGGAFNSTATGISNDGTVIVGGGNSTNGNEAFRWTSGTGMVGLGDLAGGAFNSVAFGVSADGNIVVGRGSNASGFEAFRWTSGTGMVGLGDLAGGSFSSTAYAANDDGSIIVGLGTTASGSEAFRWTQATGIESLATILSTAGVNLTGYTLTEARDVDSTGNIVVGAGTFGGNTIAFVANLATGGLTTPDNLVADLQPAIIPIQQAQSSINHSLGQSLFASTLSSSIFISNIVSPIDADINTLSPASIKPAAGDEGETESDGWTEWMKNNRKPWSAYAVGTFGMGQNNNTDNTTINGTTGLIVRLNEEWTAGVGVIGNNNRSEMPYGGESILQASGGSLITSYESRNGFRLYGSAFTAYMDIDTKRHYQNGAGTDVSKGSTKGIGYGIGIRSGWELDFEDAKFMPYGELHFIKTKIDSYMETGGAFPATFGSSNGYQSTGKIGTQIKYDLTPSLNISTRLALAHRLHENNTGISANTTGFNGTLSNNTPGDKNWAELTAESGWQATESTYLRAEVTGRSGRVEEPMATITLGISTRF